MMLYLTKSAFFENSLKAPSLSSKGSATRVEPRGGRGSASIGYCILERRCQEVQRVHLRTWRTSQTLRVEGATRHPRRVDRHVVPCERQLGQASSNDESDAW